MMDRCNKPNGVRPGQTGLLVLVILSVMLSVRGSAALLVREDFNGAAPWSSRVTSGTQGGVVAVVSEISAVGTYDTQDSDPTNAFVGTASGALVLTTTFSGVPTNWSASLVSGPLALLSPNMETNLAKLTLSFDLNPNNSFPIDVAVQSLDNANNILGSRTTRIIPRVIGSPYRYSVDLDQTLVESGSFSPTAPKVQVVFRYGSSLGWPSAGTNSLVVDNVSYTSPKYYVSASLGTDTTANSQGLSEAKPFRTIQYAVNLAVAGDVICVMSGTYEAGANTRTVVINKVAAPDAWLVLRDCPGSATPVIRCKYWDTVYIQRPACYIEVRDLEVWGYRPAAGVDFSNQLALAEANVFGTPQAQFNTGGISVDGRTAGVTGSSTEAQKLAAQLAGAHHVRIVNNVIHDFPGGGIGALNSDYVTSEGNTIYGNCFFTRYGPSGISYLHSWNFDQYTGHKNFYIGNTCYDNRTYASCVYASSQTPPAYYRKSDGNGIIVDTQSTGQYVKNRIFGTSGRTLVAGNVVFGNGGAGVAITSSWKVDVFNNTLYWNVQTPEFKNGDFSQSVATYPWYEVQVVLVNTSEDRSCSGINFRNNIIWAENYKNLTASGVNTPNVYYDNNLYYAPTGTYTAPVNRNASGTASTPPVSAGNVNAAAGSVILRAPSLDFTNSPDFRPVSNSPALDMGGLTHVLMNRIDRRGSYRPSGTAIDAGAYERPAAPPAPMVTIANFGYQISWAPELPIAFYSVYRALTNTGPYTNISAPALLTDGTFLDSTATPGTGYFYKITASNESDESALSAATFSIPSTNTPTSTALTSGANPATSGMGVTFTATVTSTNGIPGGTVTFADGGIMLATSSLNGLGVAVFTTNGLSLGSHPITAAYGGSASHEPSLSSVLTQIILPTNGSASSISLTNTDLVGTSSFNAKLNWNATNAPAPGHDYFTAGFLLRTPTTAGNHTFLGDSLQLDPRVTAGAPDLALSFKSANNAVITITNLIMAGGGAGNATFATTYTLAGNISVISNSWFGLGNAIDRFLIVSARISGTNSLTNGAALHPLGTITYTGNNTNFTGPMITGFNGIVRAGSQANLGGNPANFNAAQFELDNGTFSPTASFALNNPNSGVTISDGGGRFDIGAGLTLTNANPLSGPGLLTKAGPGTLRLQGDGAGFTGEVLVNAGTLALGGGGSLSSAPFIIVAGGATLDCSGLISTFYLASGQVLSNGAAATVNLVGNLNTSAGVVAMSYAAGTPAFSVAGGTLTLTAETVVKVNNLGAALAASTNKLIAKGVAGSVAGSLPPVTVTGGGIVSNNAAWLQISGDELYLVVAVPPPPIIHPPHLNELGELVLRVDTLPGLIYGLWSATNLIPPVSWSEVESTFGTGGTISNTVPFNSTEPQMFFRYQVQ